jgi:hypothetical protein
MSIRLSAVLLMVLPAIPCLAAIDESMERPIPPPSAAAIAADEAARQALAEPVTDQEFTRIPLSNAIGALREKSGAKVFVNWKSMAMIHVSPDTLVTVGIRGKTLKGALDAVFTVAGADREQWGIHVDDGVIVVTSNDDVSKNVSVRIYDVREMIGRPADDERQRRVNALVRLIQDQIDSPSWKERGGQAGAIRELNGQLIVTQTPENQEKLIKLLDNVRALFVDPMQHSR